MGSIVTHVERGWVLVRDHAGDETRYDAGTVLWTAGVEAPPGRQRPWRPPPAPSVTGPGASWSRRT